SCGMSPTDEGADGTLDRRAFMERLAGFAAAAGLSRDAPVPPRAPAGTFNGIQMGPPTILDAGIERTHGLIAATDSRRRERAGAQSDRRHGRGECGDAIQPRLQRRPGEAAGRARGSRRAADRKPAAPLSAAVGAGPPAI